MAWRHWVTYECWRAEVVRARSRAARPLCGTADPLLGIGIQTRVLRPESLLGDQSHERTTPKDLQQHALEVLWWVVENGKLYTEEMEIGVPDRESKGEEKREKGNYGL